MGLLNEIGTRLSDQSLASSAAANGYQLFLSMLPDTTSGQDKAVAIIETAGFPPDPRNPLDKPGFQVLVRGASIFDTSTSYEETEVEAQAIYADLHGITTISLSSRNYAGIFAQQTPFLLEYDSQNRPVIACNYVAFRSRT